MKSKLWVYTIISFFLLLISIGTTYALFETNGAGDANLPVGSWLIKLNGKDISTGVLEDFTIKNVSYSTSENVETGYIAPGRDGYFDIILDPTDTSVAVRYDVIFEKTDYPENIQFDVEDLSSAKVIKTAENTFSGVINFADVQKGKTVILRLNVKWIHDEIYNNTDSDLGLVQDNTLSIPVTVRVIQYLGEDITAYE